MAFFQTLRRRDPLNHSSDLEEDDIEKQKRSIRLRIKSLKDVEVHVSVEDTIATVKKAVLSALETPTKPEPYIRLIAAGRLLAPDTALLQDFHIQNDHVIHAVVSNKSGAQAAAASPCASNALRGSGIDATGRAVRRRNEDEEDEESERLELGQRGGRHRLGFDRLRDSVGFRRSEVATIRAYFSRSVDRWIRDNPAAAEEAARGETDLVQRRLLQEEAWMQSQGPTSEFRLNMGETMQWTGSHRADAPEWRGGMSVSVGTDRDFVWGFCMGFFVGLLMLLWVWIPSVPHKQKLGILTGICVQLVLSQLEGTDPSGLDDLVLSDY
ncbi:hypothetical protein FisN_19Hh253 [Fistulifera solaris]|jgi:hypothetical protein|uniref:Ubiquitin-like domain-containing protein n=1 Tax=Fistulifera solaris TaxID=1519565 RepID=A0A1Z5K0X2_FISSO|nr:hypothetical protein FisN_19Hh253 [Fistulifera solaris]|eukprot:GAX19668.1 hypothetical protein FisN_19Hh253 [Fistulifera solaris]